VVVTSNNAIIEDRQYLLDLDQEVLVEIDEETQEEVIIVREKEITEKTIEMIEVIEMIEEVAEVEIIIIKDHPDKIEIDQRRVLKAIDITEIREIKEDDQILNYFL